ncbi:MAG: hypothetical protein V3V47_01845 [Desulfobacteria bacterium]
MKYDYDAEREAIFTEEGQVMFIAIRDRVKRLLGEAGAVRMEEAICEQTGLCWTLQACVDRLVELDEICEVTSSETSGQYRVFVSMEDQA